MKLFHSNMFNQTPFQENVNLDEICCQLTAETSKRYEVWLLVLVAAKGAQLWFH
jgi:hypothetical protein